MAIGDRPRGWVRGDLLSVIVDGKKRYLPTYVQEEPMVTVPYVKVVKLHGGQLRCINCGCSRFTETAEIAKYRDYAEVLCDDCNLRSGYARNGMPIGLAKREMQNRIEEESRTAWERRIQEVMK